VVSQIFKRKMMKENVESQPEKAGAVAPIQQRGVGKLVKVAVGGKLHRRGGKAHFPHEL
jgi:hypothetical protein